jgi:hypothetical protein
MIHKMMLSALVALAIGSGPAANFAPVAAGEVRDGATLVAQYDRQRVRVGPYRDYDSAARVAIYYQDRGHEVHLFSVQGLYFVDVWID